jgi:Na+/melibiose symporter-like transporter
LVSEDNNVRIQYNIFKIFGANTGGLLVTAFTMDIIHRMGGETIGNYFKTAGVYGVIGIAGLLLCGIGVKEIKRKPTPGNMSFHTSCRVAAENPHWILFCIVMFLSMFYMILHNQGTIYYTKYYLNDTSLSSVILTMTPLASAIMSFLMPKMTERYGIRKVMLAGNLIMISSLFGTWFAGKNRVLVLLMSAATSVGWAIAMGMVFVTIPQLIDYSEWKTGYRPQGFMTSVVTFLMKMGVAFAGFLSPFILSLGGYHAGDRLSQNAIKAILADYIFLPALLSVLVMILMFFYGLDKLYPQISEQLKLKK